MKRCRLRLIRSLLLYISKCEENLILKFFLEYLDDNHPLIRQWAVETIVYLSSVTENQNNLIHMLFRQPKIRTIITDYLEMKTNFTYNHSDFTKYFEHLSIRGKFQHTCSFNDKLDKVLDKLKADIDSLNDVLCNIEVSEEDLNRLNEYSLLLNNICKAKQFSVKNI